MRDRWIDTTNDFLQEMFRRVGDEYNPETAYEDCWYYWHEWTMEENDAFSEWMVKILMKRMKLRRRKAEYEAGMFLLNWGWKIKDGKRKKE